RDRRLRPQHEGQRDERKLQDDDKNCPSPRQPELVGCQLRSLLTGLLPGDFGARGELPLLAEPCRFVLTNTLQDEFASMEGSGDMGASPNCYAVACSTGIGRSTSGLKNQLPRAAKMIGAKPITTA